MILNCQLTVLILPLIGAVLSDIVNKDESGLDKDVTNQLDLEA